MSEALQFEMETRAGLYIGLAVIFVCWLLLFIIRNFRNILVFLARNKVITMPRSQVYAIEMRIMVDGKVIKQFPVEVAAPSRRSAKFEAQQRVSVTTGTVAKKVDLLKYNKK